MNIKSIPALKLLILAIAGIILGSIVKISSVILLIFSLALILIYLLNKNYSAILYIFFGLFIGLWISQSLNNSILKIPNKIIPKESAILQGKIVKTLKLTNKYYKCIVKGSLDTKSLDRIKNTKAILKIYNIKYKQLKLIPGEKIFAKCKVLPPHKSILPNEFSEYQYAMSLGANWIADANAKEVSITQPHSGFYFIQYSIVNSIQRKINLLFPVQTRSIVTALLTGDKAKIPYETKQLFSLSGTAHVLAVSGLHVGIIALIIFVALGFVKNRWLKFIIFSVAIISFVILTGVQPSALRAGFMAILILFVKSLQRRVDIVNILAFAILILLIFNPELIYSIGFLMSISAVFGIILFYKPIKEFAKLFIKTDNKIITYIINSFAVSISASILISPIIAYYFNNISFISPLTNLFVVPLISLSLIFSIISVFFSYFYIPLAIIYANSANFMISLAMDINKFALTIPYSYIRSSELVLPAIIISILIIYLIYSKTLKRFIFRFALSIIAFFLVMNIHFKNNDKINIYPRQQLVVVDFPKHNNQKDILLIDRKPSQLPDFDLGLNQYILNLKEKPNIYYCGNTGLSIVDWIKKKRKISYCEMDIQFQKELKKFLKSKKELHKIIDFNTNVE